MAKKLPRETVMSVLKAIQKDIVGLSTKLTQGGADPLLAIGTSASGAKKIPSAWDAFDLQKTLVNHGGRCVWKRLNDLNKFAANAKIIHVTNGLIAPILVVAIEDEHGIVVDARIFDVQGNEINGGPSRIWTVLK